MNTDTTQSRRAILLPFLSSSSTTSNASNQEETLMSPSMEIVLRSRISVDHSSNILTICEQLGGVLNLIYLFAKIFEIEPYSPETAMCHICDIIFTSIWKNKSFYHNFLSLNGYRLVSKILITHECGRHLNERYCDLLIEKSVTKNDRLYDIHLFRDLLLDWRIWHQHTKIFSQILNKLKDLLCNTMAQKCCDANRRLFKKHFSLENFLFVIQEIIEEQQQIVINTELISYIVDIVESLAETDEITVTLLMSFVLFIHPLIKTYVTFNPDHFYFVHRSCEHYQKEQYSKPILLHQQIRPRMDRQRSINRSNDDPFEENSNFRKSHSATDLASMSITIINESENPRRNNHYLNVSSVNSNSKISKSPTNEINRTGTKNDSHHCIDLLATRILQLLAKITMVASDRLISQLISKKVLNLNVLTVLLLDAPMSKLSQCLQLVNQILKRMDGYQVVEAIQTDTHIMLANQIYHRLGEHEYVKKLIEVCVSIALQWPGRFDIS